MRCCVCCPADGAPSSSHVAVFSELIVFRHELLLSTPSLALSLCCCNNSTVPVTVLVQSHSAVCSSLTAVMSCEGRELKLCRLFLCSSCHVSAALMR
ncbi:uncharacterized protein V6R79_022682 [Siganus canaliculatus]